MDDLVDYHGSKVVRGWPEKIEAAQKIKSYSIAGVKYLRIPYGSEAMDYGADDGPCGDCATIKGQLHVATCSIERCPCCLGQAFWCDCSYDDAEA